MSEAFSVPFLTLIKLCYTKALKWSSLVPGPEAKSPSLEIRNPTLFSSISNIIIILQSFRNRKIQLCPLFATPWTAAHQAPLSMEFSRQEHWRGLPFPSPGIFLMQGLNPSLLRLLQRSWIFNYWTTREAHMCIHMCVYIYIYMYSWTTLLYSMTL